MTTDVYLSYDYELLWGVWDKTSRQYVERNVARANAAAGALVDLHKRLDFPATFAIVGAMLEEHPAGEETVVRSGRTPEQAQLFRELLEQYEDAGMCQAAIENLEALEADERFEIASHSYAHLYALESTKGDLSDDFDRFAERYSKSFGRSARSLVMPKNQVSPDVLELAHAKGFSAVRTNPPTLLYSPIKWGSTARKVIRLLRFADSFLPLLELTSVRKLKDRREGRVRILIGQYFVRVHLGRDWMAEWHLARLKLGFWLAKLRGHSAHYWCHPHNFGADPERALGFHELLLTWLKGQEAKGNARLLRMSDNPGVPAAAAPQSPVPSTGLVPGTPRR